MFVNPGQRILSWAFYLLYHLHPVSFLGTGRFHIWFLADGKFLYIISAPVNFSSFKEICKCFFFVFSSLGIVA